LFGTQTATLLTQALIEKDIETPGIDICNNYMLVTDLELGAFVPG